MSIKNLATHPARYLTVAELAEYWAVSRQQIYKRIESGTLDAIRLGSRLYRVPAHAALEFERRARVPDFGRDNVDDSALTGTKPASPRDKLPDKLGGRSARKLFVNH